MFEKLSADLVGFDLASVCFGITLCIAATCTGAIIIAIVDLIKWFIMLIFNRNSPPSGEDK